MEVTVNNNYKTAITRGGPSAPIRTIIGAFGKENGTNLVLERIRSGRLTALDYGCGRGEDANWLGCERYDPYWYPRDTEGELFDYVFCTYVLNVVDRDEQFEILGRLLDLTKPNGMIYVTVRRDVRIGKPIQRDGYRQSYVLDGDMKLHNFHSWHLDKSYEIYCKRKNDIRIRSKVRFG